MVSFVQSYTWAPDKLPRTRAHLYAQVRYVGAPDLQPSSHWSRKLVYFQPIGLKLLCFVLMDVRQQRHFAAPINEPRQSARTQKPDI